MSSKILLDLYENIIYLIFTCYYAGLGVRGDVVVVPKRQGRYELLKPNKAVYASPENIEEFAKQDDGRDLPLTVSAVSETVVSHLQIA